ncbi:MAG: nitroreductase family deazaflavin-dependent oxidoreductase [Chloroflexi bacterium]|nr:nitroreductase family deazaflavin-dependent oxidoreductase [Chloroflexota bacterium]
MPDRVMPLPRSVARFNRGATNRVLGPLARFLPHFGVVAHRGRRSGREYRTPVNIFHHRGGLLVALTYGPESDWVRNVLAAGGCTIETGGHKLRLRNPRLLHDPTHRAVPSILRPVGRLGHVSDFLELDLVPSALSHVPAWVGPFNAVARRLLAAGVPMGPNGLITVAGRKTGLPRSTPVTVIPTADRRYVLGVYGEVDWVRNLRTAGRARITLRGRSQSVHARELTPEEAVAFFRDVFAPLVRRYGGIAPWIVRHVDHIDVADPVGGRVDARCSS